MRQSHAGQAAAKAIRWAPISAAADIATVARLASEIWQAHYTPLIGSEQVAYMLERFQSPAAIAEQVAAGMHYWLIVVEDQPAGYLAAGLQGDALFISKFYLRSSQRGRGLGRESMNFLAEFAKERGAARLALTVNRHNSSVAIYQSLGFVIDGTVCQDIGSGYVMDDYRMSVLIEA